VILFTNICFTERLCCKENPGTKLLRAFTAITFKDPVYGDIFMMEASLPYFQAVVGPKFKLYNNFEQLNIFRDYYFTHYYRHCKVAG
jgi:hypothetical protein